MSDDKEQTNVNFNFSKTMKFFVMLIILILAFFSVLNLFSHRENDYCDVIEIFHDGIKNKDLKKITGTFLDIDELKREKEVEYQDILNMILKYFGDDYDVSYHILKEEILTDDELDSLEEKLRIDYGNHISLKKGYEVRVETIIKNEKLQNITTMTFTLGYVNFKWYMIYWCLNFLLVTFF